MLNSDSAVHAVTLSAEPESQAKTSVTFSAESLAKTTKKSKTKSSPVPKTHSGKDTFHTVTAEEVFKPVVESRKQWDLEELGRFTIAKKESAA
jgi:hypothetical protein